MRTQAGFTMVEVVTVLGIAAVLAGLAVPTYQQRLLQARRADAVAAVGAVHAAQERFRNNSGRYAPNLATLRAAPVSAQGLYTMALRLDGTDGYTVVADAQGAQVRDRECNPITLSVRQGFESVGPSARCWGR